MQQQVAGLAIEPTQIDQAAPGIERDDGTKAKK
jgi:hypothetical protein